jgi:PAS domain S-box-containing protein
MHEKQKRIKVLHVDDEPDFLALTKAFLERENVDFSVDIATSAGEATELLKGGKYDVVVSDYKMSVIDGLEFLKTLRASGNTIPFIMFTGKGREEVAIEALNRGANGYLQKGVDVESMYGTLAHVIREEVAKKRAEDELRNANKQLRDTIEFLPDATFVIDRDKKVIAWNRALEEMTGVRKEDIIGKGDYTYAVPFYGIKRPLLIDLVTLSDEEIESRYKYVKREGNTLFAEIFISSMYGGKGAYLWGTATPLYDSKGSIVGAIESIRDITERKRAEEKLARIVDGVNIPAFAINKEHKITHWNTALESLTEVGREDVVGTDKQWIAFYAERRPVMADLIVDGAPESKFKDWYGDKYKKSSLIESAYEGLDFFLTLGGKWLLFTAAPLCDSEGKIIGAIETLQDITELKRAEEALKKEKEFTESALNTLSDMFYVFDIEGRFLQWNKTANAVTGYSDEEISSMKPTDFFSEEDKERVEDAIGIAVKEGRHASVEATLITKDGRHIPYEFRGALLKDPEGNAICLSGVGRDLTDRKHAEEALQENESEHQIILDYVPVSIFHIDANSRFVRVNEVLAKRHGMKPENFKGKTSKELFPEIGEEYIKSDKEVLESGEPQIGVTRKIKTPEGARWVRLDKVPFKDADGNVTGIIGFELDITKSIEAQEELRNAHKELQDILEFLPDATFVIDQDKKVIAWNRAIEEMTGVRKEDIIGKGDYEYALPFYGERRPILTDLVFSSDEEIESRYAQVGKKGTTLFVEIYSPFMYGGKGAYLWGIATPLYDSKGSIVGAIESIRDISDWREAEKALRESEEKYRELVNTSVDAIISIDSQMDITLWNPRAERLFQYTEKEMIGQTLMKIVPERYRKAKERGFIEYGKTGSGPVIGNTLELEVLRKDGTEIPVELSVSSRKVGKTHVATAIVRDITERKRIEAKLVASENEYRSLVESTEDSVFLVDRDCRYLFVNEKHLSRLGMPKDQVIGKTYGELHSEEDTEEFAEIVEEVFETDKSVWHEHRSRRDNRYILRTVSPVKDPEGRVTAVTLVSKDITERKRAEEERERLLKVLEAKSTELDRFAYTVSHDLRSPLITIQGFTDMVQTDLAQNELEKAKDNLTFIDKAAIKMDRLLSDTLQLSRAGRMTNPPEDVPFGEIVKDALEQTVEQIKSSGVEVSVAEDFPTVHVDRMRIAEVLVNLIVNSINYRGDQPHPEIDIGYRVDSGEGVFFLKDNGIGMDESQDEKVFDLFYQIEGNNKGTGAGLAIVKRIIEVHGGRIWIESEMGKGCTICFTLPVT